MNAALVPCVAILAFVIARIDISTERVVGIQLYHSPACALFENLEIGDWSLWLERVAGLLPSSVLDYIFVPGFIGVRTRRLPVLFPSS